MAQPKKSETVENRKEAATGLKKSLDDLARLYLVREFLISKLANGRVALSAAEQKANRMMKDDRLQALLKIVNKFMLVKTSGRNVRESPRAIVDRCRSRRDRFVDRTVGETEYTALMFLSKSDLQDRVRELVRKRIPERVGEQQLEKFLSAANNKVKEGF